METTEQAIARWRDGEPEEVKLAREFTDTDSLWPVEWTVRVIPYIDSLYRQLASLEESAVARELAEANAELDLIRGHCRGIAFELSELGKDPR